jgi:hypothetical protein
MTPARSNTMEEMPTESSNATLIPEPAVSACDLPTMRLPTCAHSKLQHAALTKSLRAFQLWHSPKSADPCETIPGEPLQLGLSRRSEPVLATLNFILFHVLAI